MNIEISRDLNLEPDYDSGDIIIIHSDKYDVAYIICFVDGMYTLMNIDNCYVETDDGDRSSFKFNVEDLIDGIDKDFTHYSSDDYLLKICRK